MNAMGCITLIVGQLCFSGDRITCSDGNIPGIEACKAQYERVVQEQKTAIEKGYCSKDGSSCASYPAWRQ